MNQNNLNKKDKKNLEDLVDAINSNNLDDLVEVIKKTDKKKVKLLFEHSENSSPTPIEQAFKNASIEIIKYLVDGEWGVNILEKSKSGKTLLEIAEDRQKESGTQLNEQIVKYLQFIIKIKKNDFEYKKSLFSNDLIVIEKISFLFKKLEDCFVNNYVLVKIFKKHTPLNESPNDFFSLVDNNDNKSHEYLIIDCLRQISELISFLGNHEGSIKNKINIIPWDLLQSIQFDLMNNPLLQDNPRKLFEKISSEILYLSKMFQNLTNEYLVLENYESFISDKHEQFDLPLRYKQLFRLNFVSSNRLFIVSSVKNIQVIESLDLKESEDEKFSLIQCLQNIGEISKHFSSEIKAKIEENDFNFKHLRDDIAHICEKKQNFQKFLDFLKNDKILQNIKNLVIKYRRLLDFLNDNLENLEKNAPLTNFTNNLIDDEKKILKKRWLDKCLHDFQSANVNTVFVGYVERQVEVIKFAINEIQKIVQTLTEKKNYIFMRQELKSPRIHSKCLFFLTIIGQSIQAIKSKDNFLSIVTYDLFKELDFLKWVRNAIMHLDKISENGTLVDYLSNDLLTDFSILTHGEKIIEFSEYFNHVLHLLEKFEINLKKLGKFNYFQEYNGDDKKYFDFDIDRKKTFLNEKISKKRINSINIRHLIDKKKEIFKKCEELNIEVIGIFGKIAKFGFATQEDTSGIFVKVSNSNMLVTLATFKQFIYHLLGFKIKVINEIQLVEYLEIKIHNQDDIQKYRIEFLKNIKKNSLDHLENNIELFSILEDNYHKSIIEYFKSTENIGFDLVLENKSILHLLCEKYQITKEPEFLEFLEVSLKKGANINVQDNDGNTILHNISFYECDKDLLDIFTNFIKEFNFDQLNFQNKCPLQTAIENENDQLIEYLKDKTNIKKYEKNLLIAATKYGNEAVVKYLFLEHKTVCNDRDQDGTPIIHYAIFERFHENETYDKKYREIIKLQLENGATVGCYENKIPLLWALEKKDIELAYLLGENSVSVDYKNNEDSYLIHLAILNIKDCLPQERPYYLKLINKIAEISIAEGNGLNQEYQGKSETPLYLAAKQEDLEVMKILLENGADFNFKNYRFSNQILFEVKNIEIIKFFIENGIMKSKLNEYKFSFEHLANNIKSKTVKKDYLENYARLFELYKKNLTDEIQQLVVENGINLKVIDENGKDLFCYALEKLDIKFIRQLVENNGVNSKNKFNKDIEINYYDRISKYANGEVLELLHEKKLIDWTQFNSDQVISISENAIIKNDEKAISLLENYKYIRIPKSIDDALDENLVKRYLNPYLMIFKLISSKEQIIKSKDAIKKLKNKYVFYDNLSLLQAAVINNNLEILKFLVDEIGLDINSQLDEKRILDTAVERNCDFEIIDYLIQIRAQPSKNFDFSSIIRLDIDMKDSLLNYFKTIPEMKTEIIENITNLENYLRNLETVKILLKLDWNPNDYNFSGYTALHICAKKGFNQTLEFLCKSGKVEIEAPIANAIIYVTSGTRTPVGWALENGNFEGARILIENGASPYKYLGLLLIDALRNENTDYFKLLLENSVIIDQDEMDVYLNYWIKDKFTPEDFSKANFHLIKIMDSDDINKRLPDHVYNSIIEKLTDITSLENKTKKLKLDDDNQDKSKI